MIGEDFDTAVKGSVALLAVVMSENPEERNRDSRKINDNTREQQAEPPLDKQDPTEPVQVKGAKEGKAAASTDVGDAGAAKA